MKDKWKVILIISAIILCIIGLVYFLSKDDSVNIYDNKNITEDVKRICEKAVNATDDYLEHYISKEELKDKIQELYDQLHDECSYDDSNDNLSAFIHMGSLQSAINESTKELKSERDILKKICGID